MWRRGCIVVWALGLLALATMRADGAVPAPVVCSEALRAPQAVRDAPDTVRASVSEAPVVTHGSVERSALSEAEVLAAHVLRSADTTPEGVPDLPDGGVGLAAEFERVLGAVRAAFPEMGEVTVRAPWEPGALILKLEPALFEAVSSALAAPGASAPLCTAEKDFDALNAVVGLVAVQAFSFASSVVLRFDPQRDVLLTALEYASVDGVRHVEPNFILGDGSDIDARWIDGTWHLVFREVSGDCPSGCIFTELHFFTERDGAVERLGAERPARSPPFVRILLEREWGSP